MVFVKVLCDATTVNATHNSNHVLYEMWIDYVDTFVPPELESNLSLNYSMTDKGRIAVSKILINHTHIDVQPFLEWEFKVMPLLVSWFEKASSYFPALLPELLEEDLSNRRLNIPAMKLSALYDFIRGDPMLYVDAQKKQQ